MPQKNIPNAKSKKFILAVKGSTSTEGCCSFPAVFSRPASVCLRQSGAGLFYLLKKEKNMEMEKCLSRLPN